MRIFNILHAEGHPRLKAKRILPEITNVTGSFSTWTLQDIAVIKTLFRKHVNHSQTQPRWLDGFYAELFKSHKETWSKFYYFAQTPELLVVPKLHIRAAIYNIKCPVCKVQWVPETQAWGCYNCTLKNPDIRWKFREAKAKANLRAKGQTSHWTLAARAKAKATSLKKFGVENAAQSSEAKAKAKATNLAKWGVSSPSKVPEVKDKVRKAWQAKSKEELISVTEKRKATCITRYAVSNPMQCASIKAKVRAAWSSKDQQAIINKAFDAHEARTGYRYPSQDPQMKVKRIATYRLRYGVDNPTQNPDILRKALRTAHNLHTVTLKGRDFKVQGSYELAALPKLVDKFGVENVLTQFSEKYPDTLDWTPDFYIKSKKYFIEIKSVWTLLIKLQRNKEKAKATNVNWLVLFKDVWLVLPQRWYLHPDVEALLVGLWLRKTLKAQVVFSRHHVTVNGKMFLNSELVERPLGVKNMLAKRSKTVFARKLDVQIISAEIASKFLNTYHVQGNTNAKHKLGLFKNKTLVAVATFRKPIITKGYDWELARMCIKGDYHVPGGASKLLAHFSRRFKGSIISYADKRYSSGGVYKAVGFKLLRETSPGYRWIKGELNYSRQKTMKHKLAKLLPVYDEALSETQNMLMNNFTKVKDKGQFVFIKE